MPNKSRFEIILHHEEILTSSIGPITKKGENWSEAKTREKRRADKASASLQSDSKKDKTIKRMIASSGVALIDVRIRVGT